jgi:hypothetical protein
MSSSTDGSMSLGFRGDATLAAMSYLSKETERRLMSTL